MTDPSPEDAVRALTRELANCAERIGHDVDGPLSELWALVLAVPGRMSYPDPVRTAATSVRLGVPDVLLRPGLTRFQLWQGALAKVLEILGDPEAHYRTGYDSAQLGPALRRFFESDLHVRPRELITVSTDDALLVADLSPTDFGTEIMGWRDKGLTIRVVRGRRMATVDGLMTEFGAALQFPHYFGENWAAFQECLEDMDWLPPGKGIVVGVSDAPDVLSDASDADLGVLIRSFARARATYGLPVADNEWWDRPAIPFHVVLQCDPSTSKRLGRWLDAGASLRPISGDRTGLNPG